MVSALLAVPLAIMVMGALHSPGEPPPVGVELLPGSPSLARSSVRSSWSRSAPAAELRHRRRDRRADQRGRRVVGGVRDGAARAAQARGGWGVSLLLMVPPAALWLPRFVLFRSLGVVDTYVPLVAPALLGMSPLYVLLFYWSSAASRAT